MVASGSNAALADFVRPLESCVGPFGVGGREATFRWTAPSAGPWLIDTFGSTYDTVLYILADSTGCATPDYRQCNDDISGNPANPIRSSLMIMALNANESIIIVVDGWDASTTFSVGDYVLNINKL